MKPTRAEELRDALTARVRTLIPDAKTDADAIVFGIQQLAELVPGYIPHKKDYEDVANEIVQWLHPQAVLLSIGGIYNTNDEPMVSGHTVTLDMAGQGQEVKVYEVVFRPDGTGVFLQVTSTHPEALGHHIAENFKWDLIDGEVKWRR